VQVLTQDPEIKTYVNEDGEHFITGFLIGTKYNEARWKINKKTAHNLVQKFIGRDFAIIPELIQTPLSQGGGGHYFGQDTKEDLLRGYAENSHGKYVKIKGPYSYNDGTDDFFYNFDAKLRDSKAAAALYENGAKTWIPFAHSPHIWPIAGPDHDITDWEPIGGALVIKGAYGPMAVISKHCKGTSAACEKSLGASPVPTTSMTFAETETRGYDHPSLCEKKDAEMADFISSLVSKSASSQTYMVENKEAPAPVVTELSKTTTAIPEAKPNPITTIDTQAAISNAPATKIVTAEESAALEKRLAELEKANAALVKDKKETQLTSLVIDLGGITDEKQKKEFVEKWFKKEIDAEILREFYNDILAAKAERRKKASEQGEPEEDEKDEGEKPLKAKGKAGSLPREPDIPNKVTESKAASVPESKAKTIAAFLFGGNE
jgi:hypothetical protein